uniref:Si:ch211-152c8.2 n=1 Tax=Amphiprion ocellaris TaxID=80972 RepID=A0A3Q1BU83_AMPOC
MGGSHAVHDARAGKDFLTEGGRLNAVSLELSTSEGQLCISVEANAVRLPLTTLEDFDLPPLVLRRFCSDPDSVLDPTSTGGALWCHVLPSMKKGEIISISRQLPRDGPFSSYRELQNHWNRLYGYRLPELPEQEVVYCSIYFRLVGQKLFTYPLSCIRLQPVQRCPGLDLQGALASFQTDIRARLLTVCGFPARLSSKPCFHTVGLKTAASLQVLDVGQINLSTSTRPVLSQLPAPPPAQPRRPSFGSQPPAWTPVSQQGGAVRHGSGFQSRATQAFLPLFQPASSLTSSSSSSGLPPPPPPPVNPPPKLVPIFRNKTPSCHVNVALLRLQEQREQLSRAAPRVTLPAVGKKTPTAPPLPPSSLPVRPPPTVPNFSRQPKVKRISSLSAASRPKPSLIVALKADVKIKPESGSRTSQQVAKETQEKAKERQPATQPVTSADSTQITRRTETTAKQKVTFDVKPKKSRSAARDVEKMARSNQLSRLNCATLLLWLKERRVSVGAKYKKEDLMLKLSVENLPSKKDLVMHEHQSFGPVWRSFLRSSWVRSSAPCGRGLFPPRLRPLLLNPRPPGRGGSRC